MNKINMLSEYIKNSELRSFSERLKVRLSKELAVKYDEGIYYNFLNNINKCMEMIDTLNIEYPGNAHPVLYFYIVPDDNYSELLNFPAAYDKGKGGGKAVRCHDLDGFNSAIGLSQNILASAFNKEPNIAQIENDIHELAHTVHSQFFRTNKIIDEGFAEALPLYALILEETFNEHRNFISSLKKEQILTAQEIIDSERDNSFGLVTMFPNRSCSFRISYISSYLFVRGCMETIARKFNLSKAQSVQYFLELIRKNSCQNEFLIYYLADELDLPRDELLKGKHMQLEIVQSLSNTAIKKNK